MRSISRRIRSLEDACIPEAILAALETYNESGVVPYGPAGQRLAELLQEWETIRPVPERIDEGDGDPGDEDDAVLLELWLYTRITGLGLTDLAAMAGPAS